MTINSNKFSDNFTDMFADKSGDNPDQRSPVIFVYDGECPICKYAAHATRIHKNVGPLLLVNAREEKAHPVLKEIIDNNLNLDEGMAIKYQDQFYHGKEALRLMAHLADGNHWYNFANRHLYKGKIISSLIYPSMRATRNMLLRIKGVAKLNNLQNKTEHRENDQKTNEE